MRAEATATGQSVEVVNETSNCVRQAARHTQAQTHKAPPTSAGAVEATFARQRPNFDTLISSDYKDESAPVAIRTDNAKTGGERE